MKTIYETVCGKRFEDKSEALKTEKKTLKLVKAFEKCVDDGVFPKYKIKPFYHNYEVSSLGNPRKSNWRNNLRGYVLVHGRMGNGDTVISFKIRGNKLLIFKWDTDDSESEGKKYLGYIILNKRLEKLKKIKEKINETN